MITCGKMSQISSRSLDIFIGKQSMYGNNKIAYESKKVKVVGGKHTSATYSVRPKGRETFTLPVAVIDSTRVQTITLVRRLGSAYGQREKSIKWGGSSSSKRECLKVGGTRVFPSEGGR